MAQNKPPVLVPLLLVFCLEIQCTVGRHLVLKQSHNFHKFQIYCRVVAKEIGAIPILDRKMNLHGDNINKAAVANTQSPPSPPSVVIGGATQAPPPKKR
ncbi:hypothetical protein PTKIN_Ptkin07bG0277100 [Pterospermum kingtungense]